MDGRRARDAALMLRVLTLLVLSLGLVTAAAACGGDGSDTAPREGPRPTEDGYALNEIVAPSPDISKAIGLVLDPASDEEAFVVSQAGFIWRVSLAGDSPPVLFAAISDRTKELYEGLLVEHGLLGLAFSPDFQNDGRVYVYYTAKELPLRTVLSRFSVVDGVMDTSSERILLEVPQVGDSHNGGQLAFGPDGYLYLGLGDGGAQVGPNEHGQNLSTLLSTIIRLDVSGERYEIPPDNPFAGEADARPEIYAYGLRNPWRFSFDSETGELWGGDVGDASWEEINHIVAGGNYGWSVVEGSDCFRDSGCDKDKFLSPHYAYEHEGCAAIIGGYVYRGASMPELDGWFVYGDFCNDKGLWAVATTGEPEPVRLMPGGYSATAFAELSNGELVVLSYNGSILELRPATEGPAGSQ